MFNDGPKEFPNGPDVPGIYFSVVGLSEFLGRGQEVIDGHWGIQDEDVC